jgi:hypothetical protein
MSNAITFAMNRVKRGIPVELLSEAYKFAPVNFLTRFDTAPAFDSVEQMIIRDVIHGRVNMDCSIKGALEIAVDLSKCARTDHNHYTRVYTIPSELLAGRSIISVKSIHYANIAHSYFPQNARSTGNMLLNAAVDLYRTVATLPVVATAKCEPIGGGAIVMEDNSIINATSLYAVLNVSHDENMNTIKPTLYTLYGDMVLAAVKSDIYLKLNQKVGEDFMKGGYTLGVFKAQLDEYRAAEEEYQDIYKNKWGKGQFTNDRNRMQKHIGMMFVRGGV